MSKYQYDVETDFDGIGGGLAYPFVNIRQKDVKSADGKSLEIPAGGFKFNDERPDMDEIPMFILFSHTGRSHWKKDDESGNPDCKSFDGRFPINTDTAYAPSCAICERSQWHGKDKPKCQEMLQFLCALYNVENDEFEAFILQLKGIALKPGKIAGRAVRKQAEEDDLAPWHYPFVVSTKHIQQGSYDYFIPEFSTSLEAVDEEMQERLDDFREELKENWLQAVASPKAALEAKSAPQLIDRNAGGIDLNDEESVETPAKATIGNMFKKKD